MCEALGSSASLRVIAAKSKATVCPAFPVTGGQRRPVDPVNVAACVAAPCPHGGTGSSVTERQPVTSPLWAVVHGGDDSPWLVDVGGPKAEAQRQGLMSIGHCRHHRRRDHGLGAAGFQVTTSLAHLSSPPCVDMLSVALRCLLSTYYVPDVCGAGVHRGLSVCVGGGSVTDGDSQKTCLLGG